MSFIMQLKCLAFSVFSRCRKTIQMNMNAKSLTGFGPAAGQEASVKNKEVSQIQFPYSAQLSNNLVEIRKIVLKFESFSGLSEIRTKATKFVRKFQCSSGSPEIYSKVLKLVRKPPRIHYRFQKNFVGEPFNFVPAKY